MLSTIRATQTRIAAIEQRLSGLRPQGASFDDTLTAQLEGEPEGAASTGEWAVAGASAVAAPQADTQSTLASWLGVVGNGAAAPATGAVSGTGNPWSGGGVTSGTELGTTPATGLTPAVPRSPGEYGRLDPPPELVAYGNGQIPTDALAPIGVGSHRLWAPAGQAFQQLQSDAAAAGVTIGVTDSYRSYDAQVDLARRKGLYSQGGLAATPGTSNHGWGMALDLDLDDAAQQWMRDNGWRYGFVESVPREPWHWEYRPAGQGS